MGFFTKKEKTSFIRDEEGKVVSVKKNGKKYEIEPKYKSTKQLKEEYYKKHPRKKDIYREERRKADIIETKRRARRDARLAAQPLSAKIDRLMGVPQQPRRTTKKKKKGKKKRTQTRQRPGLPKFDIIDNNRFW